MRVTGIPVPVFALKTVDAYMDGYYIDRDNNIWSMKGRTGQGTKLMGSSTPSGRCYTLNKRTHRAIDVVRRARAHSFFIRETMEDSTPVVPTLAERIRGDARQAAMSKAYLLATLTPTGKLVFDTDPMFHLSEPLARAEAERVAAASGGEVVLLKIVGKVKVQKAVWE